MKFALVPVLFIIFAALGTAKRVEIYRLNPRQVDTGHFIPIYKSVDDFAKSIVEEQPRDASLVLLKPLQGTPRAAQELRNIDRPVDDSVGSGRTFKHFLLLRSLMNSGSDNNHGGGNGGFIYPIIINTPVNLTNVNNNTVSNTPAAPADGGAAGLSTAADDVRINVVGLPQMQPWAMPMSMQSMPMSMQSMQMPMQTMQKPTEVIYQRKASQTVPSYTVAMFNMPGNPSFIPTPIAQYIGDNSNNRNKQRRVFKWPSAFRESPQNPLAAFASSFGNIQFL